MKEFGRGFALLTLVAITCAQEPGFRVQSRLVIIPVIVKDTKGRAVDGLESRDFVVRDNGQPQSVKVDSFATGVAPIALIAAVQSSGISAPALEKVQRIGSMIQPLIIGERGCAGLLSFDERVQWLEDCTPDADLLGRAFHKLRPGGQKSARMLDAVHEGIERLGKVPNARRVLLLISESRDRGSDAGLENVIAEAQSAGVMVYAITYSAFKTAFTTNVTKRDRPAERNEPRANRTEPLSDKGRVPIPGPEQRVDFLGGIGELVRLGKVKDTEALVSATGGASLSFARQKGLEDAIQELGGELHAQYVLSFTPVNREPGFHRIEVSVAGMRTRARPGYWASQP